MNTKKLFMLLAAVLLGSVCAFAQSGNSEPLKGDVNEDGTVDVADITAVIKIMKDNATPQTTYYFSVGTTPVTADNYTTVNNATTTIPSTKEFTNNSGSKSLVYVLVPSNKTVTAIDTYANVSINMVIDNTVTISNHKVYVTDGKIAKGSSLTFTISPQTTYYWYVGTTPYDLTNYTSLPKVNSIPSSGSITANRQYVYFVMPANKQLASLYDSTFTYEYDLIASNNEVNIYQTVGTINGTVNYTIQTTYYWYVGTSIPSSTSGNGWTSLGTDLSGISYIQVDTSNNPDYSYPTFYVIMPSSLHFKPYNSDGSRDESVGWTSTTWSVDNNYTLWTLNDPIDSINSRFKQ